MRSRSSTVHMKASPFKKPEAPQVNSAPDLSPAKPALLTKEDKIRMFEDFGPLSECSAKDCFSGNFSGLDSPRTCSTALPSISCLRTFSGFSTIDDDSTEEMKPCKLFRGMIVGAQGTGRHSLINAICPESSSDNQGSQFKQEFDLITRSIETETEINRLNFWLRETKEDQRYDSLVKMYYKSSPVFFLVYSVHDKNTLEALENEIKLIREAHPAGKELLFVLVGNKREGQKCRVSFAEALEFKHKNNIKLCLQEDLSQVKLPDIMEIIQVLAK